MELCEASQVLKTSNDCPVEVRERNTLKLTTQLVSEAGVKIPVAALSALTLKIYARDLANQPEIAGTVTSPRNILNANGGTLTETATETTLEVVLNPTDNVIVDTTQAANRAYLEWHVLLVEVTYSSGRELHQEIHLPVRNLTKVP